VAKRVGFVAFLALVAVLLVRAARAIEWQDVFAALRTLDPRTLALALALSATSYFLYTGYELAARRYAGHDVPTRRVIAIGFVVYAFSLNIGALVGGAGFRLRMYGREGVPIGRITRVIAFCVTTNWIGYIALAGALFAAGAIPLPPTLHLPGFASGSGLRVIGIAMLLAAAAYVACCALTHGRVYHVRGHHFRFPSLRLSLLQIAMAATNWALMGMVIACFLPRTGDAAIIGALLFASVATALAHIPSGIGVLEAVFVALLGHTIPTPQIIAALLAYRACYYLAPLAVATAVFFVMELSGRRARFRALP
jgi:uncharacterized membrane protein YbhN (UPF0104 family)